MSAEEVRALHQAARRYCVDRFEHWAQVYSEMRASRPATFAYSYIDDDYRVFPRYNVLDAMRVAIERWTPEDVGGVDDARARLVEAARTAESPFTVKPGSPLAVESMADERVLFERFARESTPDDWARAEPLPYRRVLQEAEAARWYEAFKRRWGHWYEGWGPSSAPPNLTLHTEVVGALPLLDTVRALLAGHGVTRLFELSEIGDSYEHELSDVTFTYRGQEAYWFTDLEWMIYASHESSITFGGAWLVDALRRAFPALDHYEYRGHDDLPSRRA